jgi:ABC-type nitrate/sulfonate/bicarbonate transport system substrate-binding protein
VTLSRRDWLAATAAMSASVMIAQPGRAAQKLKITLPATESNEAAYFIAQEKGYFAAEGLDVEFVYAGGGTATPALLSGTVDASASSASALSAIVRGADLRIVLVFQDTPNYQLWANPEIHRLSDLKGKSVGIATRGDTFEIGTRLALQNAGIPPDSVGYSPLGFSNTIAAALVSNALPAVVLDSTDSDRMRDSGQFKNAHVVFDYYRKVYMPYNGMVVSGKFLTGSPDVLKSLLRALVKGTRYFRTFKAQSIAFTAKYQKTPPDAHAQSTDYDNMLKSLSPDLAVSDDLSRSDVDLRASLNGVPKDQVPALDKIYDFRPLRAATAQLDAERWKPSA